MTLITTKDCPECKMLKSKLDTLGLKYKVMDATVLKDGGYGNTEENREAIVGLIMTNLELPVLLDGSVVDKTEDYIGKIECAGGVCKLKG